MTTDNLPAVVQDEPREVARADTDSWIGVVGEVAKFAGYIAGTDFVPKSLRDSPAAATAAIMYGREVGLPPMTALTQTHVIEGRPSMSAEAMRALILAAGHEIEVTDSTGAVCTMRGRRRGSERWSAPVTWTIDAARQAGLANKSNWKSYPRQMLQARCTAELARLVFPDVIHGFRAVEELEDDGHEETPAALPTGTKVARKSAAKKAAASLPAPREERPEPSTGPPLPGEDGYETSAGEQAPGLSAGSEPSGSPAEAQATDTGPGGPVEEEGGAEPVGTDPDEPPAGEGEREAPEPAGDSEAPDDVPKQRRTRLLNRAQQRGIEAALTALGVDNDRDERHLIASTILGRPVETMKTVTFDEASTLMDTLARLESKEQLSALLDEFDRIERENKEADRWNEGDRS